MHVRGSWRRTYHCMAGFSREDSRLYLHLECRTLGVSGTIVRHPHLYLYDTPTKLIVVQWRTYTQVTDLHSGLPRILRFPHLDVGRLTSQARVPGQQASFWFSSWVCHVLSIWSAIFGKFFFRVKSAKIKNTRRGVRERDGRVTPIWHLFRCGLFCKICDHCVTFLTLNDPLFDSVWRVL